MHKLVAVVALGLIAGVGGTSLGGLLAILLGRMTKNHLAPLLAFAGGVMLSLVILDLAPSAMALSGSLRLAAGGLIGALAIAVSEKILQSGKSRNIDAEYDETVSIGIVVMTAISLHNFAEGLAIGAGVVIMFELGVTVAILVSIHNIPEGMAIAAPFRMAKRSVAVTLLVSGMAGLPMGIGALFAGYLGGVSELFLGNCLAFSSGAMTYVSLVELIPAAFRLSNPFETLIGTCAGIMLGFIVVAIV